MFSRHGPHANTKSSFTKNFLVEIQCCISEFDYELITWLYCYRILFQIIKSLQDTVSLCTMARVLLLRPLPIHFFIRPPNCLVSPASWAVSCKREGIRHKGPPIHQNTNWFVYRGNPYLRVQCGPAGLTWCKHQTVRKEWGRKGATSVDCNKSPFL